MTAMPGLSLLDLPGLSWRGGGQAALSGALLDRLEDTDRAFRGLASRWSASEFAFPAFLAAEDLARAGYLRAFPQLATMAVSLDPDEDNVAAFAEGPTVDADGNVTLTATAPVREVLTPAACYHVYVELRGQELDSSRYVTTRNTCFRRESCYTPLERQWAFQMREIVVLGTDDEARAFLAEARTAVDHLLEATGLVVRWAHATDPFFQPERSGAFLMQRLTPVKHEAVFAERLAIASSNLHHDHFGRAFSITRGGTPVSTACIAFGLERWLYALAVTHGADPDRWPSLAEAVRHG
jgi:seryl-tRNA synthetase